MSGFRLFATTALAVALPLLVSGSAWAAPPAGDQPSQHAEEPDGPAEHDGEAPVDAPPTVVFTVGGMYFPADITFDARVDVNVYDDIFVGVSFEWGVYGDLMDLGNDHSDYVVFLVGPAVSYRARLAPWFHLTPYLGVLGVLGMSELDFETGKILTNSPFALQVGLQATFHIDGFLIGAETDLLLLGYDHRDLNSATESVISSPFSMRVVLGGAL